MKEDHKLILFEIKWSSTWTKW